MGKPLPGWSFLLVGLVVIGFSKFIESKVDKSLAIFLWTGVVFLLFGAYREFVPRLRKRPRQPKEPIGPPPHRTEAHTDHRHPAGNRMHGQSQHATHQHVAPQQHASHPYQPPAKACPRCHQSIPATNRFCPHCGFRFF